MLTKFYLLSHRYWIQEHWYCFAIVLGMGVKEISWPNAGLGLMQSRSILEREYTGLLILPQVVF